MTTKATILIIRNILHSVMKNKIILIFLILSFLFSSGCVQSYPTETPQYTNAVEGNISKILVKSNSLDEVWTELKNAKIQEKILYRPSPTADKAWILAEIDSRNNTWIAIDVDQKEIIHEGDNNSYFSGIPFDSYEDYQKELANKAWTQSSFLPIGATVTTVSPANPTPTPIPVQPSTIPEINITLIFIEAVVSFIIGAFLIFFLGYDVLDALGWIIFIICLMGAVLALISHPSSDIPTMTSELSSFFITWIFQILTMSLSGAFGGAIGAVVKMFAEIFDMGGGKGGRGSGGRRSSGRGNIWSGISWGGKNWGGRGRR
ncbi:MAG: hypothetical protein PHT99_04300 [Methanoregula sp.]|nr:hypothetical protein [Methanoregula sp.]